MCQFECSNSFFDIFANEKTLKYGSSQNFQLEKPMKGGKSCDEDMLHSYHVLHRRCEKHTNTCRFHRFVFKLDYMQTGLLSFRSILFFKQEAKLCFLWERIDKYHCFGSFYAV